MAITQTCGSTLEEAARNRGLLRIAGIDEVGRGPLFGPVVAAAVILPKVCSLQGLDDSKKLTEKKRNELDVEIRANAVCWAIAEVDAETIDRINIRMASLLAMRKAVEQLPLRPDFLLIDSRTGITELGGLATSLLADRVVCLTSTSPESVEGIQVVAEALRAAPRLASQEPLRLEFLVTRFESGLSQALSISEELGEGVTILRHDPGIAHEEQVWHRPRPLDAEGPGAPGMILFDDTLSWIGKSFPGHEQQTERARRRMRAVYRSWQYLTRGFAPSLNLLADTVVWLPSQLRERVRFGEVHNSRHADLVAYLNSTVCMIVEYVDSDEDPDSIALWWFSETQVPIVAVLGDDPVPRLYSRKGALDSDVRPSERRDLPQPGDFEALPDPRNPERLAMDHGRGVFLVRRMASDLWFDDGGTTVTFRLGRTEGNR